MASSNAVLQLMTRVLGETFAGETWATWRAVLKAAHALDLTDDERAVVTTLTQRQTLPPSPVRELWLLLGRRSGKSIIAQAITAFLRGCESPQVRSQQALGMLAQCVGPATRSRYIPVCRFAGPRPPSFRADW